MITATAKAKPEVAMTALELSAALSLFRVRLGYFGRRRAWIARCTVLTNEGMRRIGAEGVTPLDAVEELLRRIGGA